MHHFWKPQLLRKKIKGKHQSDPSGGFCPQTKKGGDWAKREGKEFLDLVPMQNFRVRHGSSGSRLAHTGDA